MKTGKLLLILILSFNFGFCQKIIKYHYVVNRDYINNNEAFLGMELEFSTVRKYYNNTEFKESRLFTGSIKDFILYKIVDNAWYYKTHKKWDLLFDFCNGYGGKVNFFGYYCKIRLDKEVTIRGKKIYKISFQPVNFKVSHKLIYYFDSREGVVIVKTSSGVILVRDDYFKKKLSNDEISLL